MEKDQNKNGILLFSKEYIEWPFYNFWFAFLWLCFKGTSTPCALFNIKSSSYISSSSSSRAGSTDIPGPLSPLFHIVHRLWQVFWLHPVSSHSSWMYVRSGRPAFARPYVGVHKSTSLMISSLLLQQCPACLVRLTWIVFVIEDRWPYSWCLVGCCLQDLFKIARSKKSLCNYRPASSPAVLLESM